MTRQQIAAIVFAVLFVVLAHGMSASAGPPTSACCAIKPTSSPTPPPTPTPAPTPTPGANQYVYHGCNIYPAGDVFNAAVDTASVDTNSATIISQIPVGTFDTGDEQGDEQTNLVLSTSPMFTVQRNGGHTPPFYPPTTAVPVINPPFIEPIGDGHWVAMTTDTCVDYEAYQAQWTAPSGPFAAYDGQKNTFSATWASQAVNGHDAVTASGIPFMGTTDWGEDAVLSVINHVMSFAMKTGKGYSQYGYIFPATHPSDLPDTACAGGPCHHPIHNGDIIRLKASFNCSVYSTKGQLVCNQMKTYGLVLADQAGSYTLRMGLTTAGARGWNYASDLRPLFSSITPANFDVIQEGAILCEAGHVYGVTCW